MVSKDLQLLTPITIDKESVNALGLVSAYYSVFESYFDVLLWNLLDLPDSETGYCITAPMNQLRKLEMFERLIDMKLADEQEINAAKALLKNMQRASLRPKRCNSCAMGWIFCVKE